MTTGSSSVRVGLALIAKNEQDRLPNLLDSVAGAFDRITLLDTGSKDNTVQVFSRWCKLEAKSHPGFTWQTGHVSWKKNFALARTQADNLLLYGNPTDDATLNLGDPQVEWRAWADCDDVIVGADNIRSLCEQANPNVAAFMVDYDYAREPDTDKCISYLRRERVVRVSVDSRWEGRVHEAQIINGAIAPVDPSLLLYLHRKHITKKDIENSNGRNLDILHAWADDEPRNPRVLGYLGIEHAIRNEHDEAIQWYERYLAEPTGWVEERAQVHGRFAQSLICLGRFDDALDVALIGHKVMPQWTDLPLRMAEAYLCKGDPNNAVFWANRALELGAPQGTLLIVNPLDYTFQVRKILAGALGDLAQYEEALRIGEEARQYFPNDGQLNGAMQQWQHQLKIKHTADTIAMMAQQLIHHDEQIKALTLLEKCVPHFAQNHPGITQLRSELRERIGWAWNPDDYSTHYEVGGSKPEDMIPDDQVDSLCERLPRTNFLLDGVVEQLGIVG